MDELELWQRYQDWLYRHEGLGLYLDISRISFDDKFVEQMQPKFAKAFEEMAALEQGSIANPDEKRMVGHYWLRDPDRAPSAALKQDILSTIQDIKTFTQQVHTGALYPPGQEKFTDLLCIGIGGSALGPQFVSQALTADAPPLTAHFIDNTDPAGIDRILNRLGDRLATTLVIVTSKSGGTPETRNAMLEVQHRFEQMGLHFSKQAVAVTGISSNLEQVATQQGWLGTFPMHGWVGGRTSELSAVGLLPAALEGIDIMAILQGAKVMDAATRVADLRQNPAAMLALSWYYVGEGHGLKDMVLLPYKDSLALFSRYLQQLVMESLGKERDLDGNIVNQGIAVYGNKGSTDQHAYVQQLREGVNNFFVTFIEVLQDREGTSITIDQAATAGDFLNGFLLGTRQALYDNQRGSITITVPRVMPEIVGALIALYERAVGLYASLVNINAYHQPGVEAGKKAAAGILDLQAKAIAAVQNSPEPCMITELASKIGAEKNIETLYQILRHLDANQRHIELSGDAVSLAQLQVSRR
ncbi:MAG: glucose-6-phosphate isomerase [Leptolyngbya sp. SIOISBB]|nr:glucose-6-phosphate isomerase [Leptolyngbya sp. SIOISBB]